MKHETEINYLKNQVKELKRDMAQLLVVLMEIGVLKMKVDENGTLVYDTDKDE